MTSSRQLALPKTIKELVQECNKALEECDILYSYYVKMHSTIGKSIKYGSVLHISQSTEETKNRIRAKYWDHALNMTGLPIYMDAKTKQDFQKSLYKDAPPFDEQTIRDTFLTAAVNKDEYMVQGIIRIFKNLCPSKYKTNSSFKVISASFIENGKTILLQDMKQEIL